MTRGGKRQGAGRPFSENPKKMYSFRLSEAEVKAVKELLAKMRSKLILFFALILLSSPVFATVESTPTIKHKNWEGYGVAQYGTREDNEYSTEQYKYRYTTRGSKNFYLRNASLLSRPCRDIQANGVVYEEPNCRIQEDGSYWHSVVGWGTEDYGTIVEYDTRWWIEFIRLYVYAIDQNGNIGKFKITENKHKNIIKQKLYGSYDTYKQVSYFVQTKIGEKPKNSGFTYDKNGKLVSIVEKQTKFSEIAEYDMNGNVISIYRKNEWDRINEYEPDGKSLRSFHDTKYIPYLQWEDTVNEWLYKNINDFQAKLFDR